MAQGTDSVTMLDECEDCVMLDEDSRVSRRIALFIGVV